MRIIDVHTHPTLKSVLQGRTAAQMRRLIAHGRRHGIVHMVALGDVLRFGFKPDAAQLRLINNDTALLPRAFPEYFTALVYLNPLLGERATMAEAERCAALPGFRGIKLEVACNSAHPCMRHVAKAARTFNLVVLQHSWSTSNMVKDRTFQSDPIDTALFARRNPDVQVIMAHLTGIGFRGILEAKSLPNLYVDTSGGWPEEELVEFAVEHLGPDRLLYGSDLPVRENAITIGRILGSRLSAAERHKVFFANTARLLNLKLN
jgi:predicted TIM-barrel fold metal-dependent hydrolase